MIPVLNNRWALQNGILKYYGLRSKPYTFKNTVKVSKNTSLIIDSLDGIKDISEYKLNRQVKYLVKLNIIVDTSQRIKHPDCIENARFCIQCCANDFTIPGLHFNKFGLCPVCENISDLKHVRDVLPVKNRIKPSKKKKYDAAILYTGGKDSSYLLYYLCQVLNLNVLALTWEIPFMSKNAISNMENAKKILKNADFISRKLPDEAQRKIYSKCFELQGNTCICPFAAYVLFIDDLRKYKIKYLISGNEPSQCLSLIFNNLAPKSFYNPIFQVLFRFVFNLKRILILKKPLKRGQIEMLTLLETLAFGKPVLFNSVKVKNPIISNIHHSLSQADDIMIPFRNAVRECSKDNNIPALVHIDFNDISKGKYVWQDVKEILKEKLNWQDCASTSKGLHTSCSIEKCKEHSQFQSFLNMESEIIPLSALELCIAVNLGCLSRKDAIKELSEHTGLCSNMPKETKIMINSFK